ncbi:MAG: pantoate--beta-alanine ligase, partial [Phenylobacterium sp.]
PAERTIAPSLSRALTTAVGRLHGGAPVAEVEAEAIAAPQAAGFSRIDYVEVRGADELARFGPGPVEAPARILAAAVLGRTRLIDNMAV